MGWMDMRGFYESGSEEPHISPPTLPCSNSQKLVTWPHLASKEAGKYSPAAFPGSKRGGMEASLCHSRLLTFSVSPFQPVWNGNNKQDFRELNVLIYIKCLEQGLEHRRCCVSVFTVISLCLQVRNMSILLDIYSPPYPICHRVLLTSNIAQMWLLFQYATVSKYRSRY